jgi:hypothetical protein
MEAAELQDLLDSEGLVARWKGLELKTTDESKRRFTGILSTGLPDRDGEIVDQESLHKAMPDYVQTNPFLAFNHDPGAGGIGTILEWAPGDNSTMVLGEIARDHEIVYRGVLYNVDNIWKQIVQGILRTLSFGFLATREDLRNGLFKLLVKDVFETSVVPIPANPGSSLAVLAFSELAKSMTHRRIASLNETPILNEKSQRERDPEIVRAVTRIYLNELSRK